MISVNDGLSIVGIYNYQTWLRIVNIIVNNKDLSDQTKAEQIINLCKNSEMPRISKEG